MILLQIFQRGGRTFPTFPTFPIPLIVFGFLGGTCRGGLSPDATTFPGRGAVAFVDELPRLPTGKLLKRLLRERYWGEHRVQI